jgi:hypothetical protein
MTSTALPFRPRFGVRVLDPAEAQERWSRHMVGAAWGLLLLNALTFYPGSSVLHIPSIAGKLITQGALQGALLAALIVNRRLVLRPNVFLCLTSLLVIVALVTTLQPQHLGTVYRTFRLGEFVVVLWLLTPWWGRRDMLLLRYHLTFLSVILGSVIVGVFLAPGRATSDGRLNGVLWPVPGTQVAHYAAIATGLVVVLWFCGLMRNKLTLVFVILSCAILVLTHTRTALVGMVAGILVAGLSLIVAKPRVRKLFVAAGTTVAVVIMTLSSFIATWLARGEGTQGLEQLSGRTKVWGPLLALPRDKFQEIFGFGLSNSSFDGLPIDSNWLSAYLEQGLLGVAISAAMLLFLLVTAYFQPRGVQRALALFLVTYCLIASFTEDGFTDATPYMLELVLAASLLVPPIVGRRPGLT